MTIRTVANLREYGVDAPPVPVAMAAATAASAAGTVALARRSHRRWAALGGLYTSSFAVSLGLFLHATLRGKFAVWERLLDELDLAGDETVVDLGCGRGAVLVASAERVPRGRVIGVDLWRGVDQLGNAAHVTRANAEAHGVGDRVELLTADLTDLPLPDASVDLVVSSLAVHNIKSAEDRDTAIRQAARVLRPGGRLVIADIANVRRYAGVLAEAGLGPVEVHDLGWRMWYGPGFGAHVVRADKPA